MQFCVFLLLVAVFESPPIHSMLTGSVAKCKNEGEEVKIALISHNPCIVCMCMGGEVVCKKRNHCVNDGNGKIRPINAQNTSPSCYLVVNSKTGDRCKGCTVNGTEYESGKSWSDPKESCISHTCHGGVVTSANVTCYNGIENVDRSKGECCSPLVRGCKIKKTIYNEGEKIRMGSDPCKKCTCRNGNIYCQQTICPVLPCPSSRIYKKPGQCCPQCLGERKFFEISNRCLLGKNLYKSGETIDYDKCTSCTCRGSSMVCDKEVCKPIRCKYNEEIKMSSGSCCAKCVQKEPLKNCTSSDGSIRSIGEVWKPDICTSCVCGPDSEVRCSTQACPIIDKCPPGKVIGKLDGKCCQRCVQKDAVCTVFGDPHYRTFDNRIFNFQGSCKYLLTKDCGNGDNSSFTVKVRNDDRKSQSFSWTKTVTVMIEDINIALEQHLVVRVHHKRVKLPYIRLGIVSITSDGGYNVVIRASSGLKIVWDGDSFVEVTVPATYRNKLCGLCGNFNNKKRDDFRTKKRRIAKNSIDLGRSWRVGSRSKCGRPHRMYETEPFCRKDWDVRIRAVKMCNALKSTVFKSCHKVISPIRYFKSCMMDMCECSIERRCYCEALTAYAHACSRAGVDIEWRHPTNCTNLSCPVGATYSLCGPGCKQTCRNHHLRRTCAKKCVAGCQCPEGTVVHKNRCIKRNECPARRYRPVKDRVRGAKKQRRRKTRRNRKDRKRKKHRDV